MTTPPEAGSAPPKARPHPRGGLRARLWFGALAGALAAFAGIAAIVTAPGFTADPALRTALAITAGAALLVALLCALWLDRGIVTRMRLFEASARASDPAPLNERAVPGGWGEIAELRVQLVALVNRYRLAARGAEQLETLERQAEIVREHVREWIDTERWSALPPATGAMQSLIEALNRGFARQVEIADQNQEAARQVQAGGVAATAEAREAAEQSERGFVEVTSLLTTVRELERLGNELHQSLIARAAEPGAGAPGSDAREWFEPAATALRDLVDTAWTSVDDLAAGLARVHELSSDVHVLGNRATLIALNSMLAARRGESHAGAQDTADELKQLAREARVATDRVRVLADEAESGVRAARERMRAVRDQANEQLARLEPPPTAAAPALGPDTRRALDRVREMVTDAARKSERLSAAGERASRAADRLVRRLDESLRDLEGLVVRLSPPASGPARASGAEPRRFDVIGRDRPAPGADESGRRAGPGLHSNPGLHADPVRHSNEERP